MKRTRRLPGRLIRWISLSVCLVLIASSLITVPIQGTKANAALVNSQSQPSGLLSRLGGFLAMFLLPQGGGPPSVPGANLPNLDSARQVQFQEPVAPPPIASELGCPDCEPCPTCGPGTSNHAPVVNHGGPYFGSATQTIVFDGLSSFDIDPADGISDYAWNFGDNTAVVHGGTPSHVYQSSGNYTVSLTVTDRHNATSTSNTTASVMGAPTPTPTPGPSPSPGVNNSLFVSQTVPATMTAGSRYPVAVKLRNTGSTTWSAAHLYRLGSQNPQDNGNWGMARVYLRNDVTPGAEVTFTFTVSAPAGVAGTTTPANFQWRMVQDGVEWFGDTHNDVVSVSTPYQMEPPPSDLGDLFTERLEPNNRTGAPGEDLVSGNFNRGLGVLYLAGRAGLNLGLSMSYNSLVWTKFVESEQTAIIFDADRSFPSAGFRLGFPSIQGPFTNSQANTSSYLMLMPSGSRVEFRRLGTSNVYESVDSSYLQLLDGGNGSLLVRTAHGVQLAFWSINSEYRCTEVKDRNGNYITIKYDPINGVSNLGRITSIIDTLGRTINFNYDSNVRLQTITQVRNGQTHVWASFGYTNLTVETNFEGQNADKGEPQTAVLGLPGDGTIAVLTQVGLDDGSRYNFDYTVWGQVYRIRRHAADGHQLSYTEYNLPVDNSAQQADCPRFTQRSDWVENWNSGNAAVTNFAFDPNGTWGEVTAPDGTVYKEHFIKGYDNWRRGLVTSTEIFSSDNLTTAKKTTVTDWTQDLVNVAYPLNPRVAAVTTSDSDGNRSRTTIEYAEFGLPFDVFEWGPVGSTGWTILRRSHTDYDLSEPYLFRRIIGLPKQQFLFSNEDNAQRLYSKTSYEYDAGGEFLQSQGTAVQHDASNYGLSFVQGRGNMTSVRRWDVNHETESSYSTVSRAGYNTTGSPIFSRDPLNHQTTVSYTDSFSPDGTNTTTLGFTTLAYPTSVTDAENYAATAKYNYDLGMVTRGTNPLGAAQTTQYDTAGRVKQVTNAVNGAYTRFVYPTTQTIVNQFTTINDLATETYSATVFDGARRARAKASDFPNSTGHYSGIYTSYNIMGRAVLQTNPTEMNTAWTASGDDSVGWYSSSQTYDWQGRPLITTNQDGTTKEASYGGCGCAGGAVTTATDEMGRRQRIYSDLLGRTFKSEVLKEDGSIYSATITAYNARDQVTAVKSYKGAATSDFSCPSGTCMQSVRTFDGYGRLATQKLPQQSTVATYAYNADDSVHSVTDPRGVVATNTYNSRQLLTDVSYSAPSGIEQPAPVSFGYDAAGNKTSMTDGTGGISYNYDQLSRMTSETRTFSLPNFNHGYTTSYYYNLSGALTAISDPFGASVSYWYDQAGRLSSMDPGTGYPGVTHFISNMQYRAFGAPKHATYGNSVQVDLTYNSRMQIGQYQVSGFQAPYTTVGAAMSYYADGRTNTAYDLSDSRFDRKYEFDFSARLKEAYSGLEAHGQPPSQANGPYRQSYTYNEFNDVLTRSGKIWGTNDYDSAIYNDNKQQNWSYDAAGNAIWVGGEGGRTYDAAGRPVTFISSQNWQVYPDWPPGHPDAPALETSDTFDGSGQVARHVSTFRHDDSYDPGYGIIYGMSEITSTTYYLHSTVLGGKTLVELAENGSKAKGYVYAGSARVATQGGSTIMLECTNPVTGNTVMTDIDASYATRQEPDPLGRDLTTPPDPTVVVDPLANPKWYEPMPIEYSPHWTGELEIGMGIYTDRMEMVIAREAYKRWLKSEKTSNPDRKIWEEILNRNPNVGIIAGKKSYWGEDATEFLNNNAASISLAEGGIAFARTPQDSRIRQRVDDCTGFANAVAGMVAGRTWKDRSKVMDELARTFVGATGSSPREMLQAQKHRLRTPTRYGSSGFQAQFVDPTEPTANQVRHYVGGLIAGFNLGGPSALAVMNSQETLGAPDYVPDTNLNAVSTRHGANLRRLIAPTDLPDWIRRDVCTP